MEIQTVGHRVVRPNHVPKGLKNPLWRGVGERLRSIGIEHNLSQRQIADAAGISQNAICQIELGRSAPRLDILERIANSLDISSAWLAFGEQAELPFRQRYPRPLLPPEPPEVLLANRELRNLYSGLPLRLKTTRQLRDLSMRELVARVVKNAVKKYHAVSNEEDATITPATISLLEKGINVPTIDTCWLLALGLDVSPGWLAYGEGEGIDDGAERRS